MISYKAVFVTVGVLMLAFLIAYFGFPAAGAELGLGTPEEYHQVCQDEFSEDYRYQGWMAGNPPIVQCKGPNGTLATMDMPEWMAEQEGLEAAAYHG